MAQDTIDKIINIQFRYSDLIKGWEAASTAIDTAKAKLQKFKEAGDSEGVAKQAQIIKALRTEMSAYTREIQANIREEVKLNGSVENLRAGIQKLTAQYNKLGRAERNNAKIGGELSAKIREMQTELNEANASLLNFRDNVGNYASAAKGFTPLAFQVQQLAREFPSLTISAQQFFLAISNNLPMLADELKRASANNKALRAEGKMTIPVFRQVISSIFSWQTALVVGITLLTAYGKEIGAWVKKLFTAEEAITAAEYAQKQLNTAQLEGRNAAQAEVVNLQILYNATQNTALAYKDRLNAVKELQKQYPAYFGNMSQEKILAGELSETYEMLVRNIMAKAQAEAAQNQIVTNLEKKNTIEQIQAYQNLTRVMADYNRLKAEGADDKMLEGYAKAAYALRKEVDSELKKMNEDLYNEVRDNSNSYQEYINNLNAANSKLVKVATDNLLVFQNTQKEVIKSSNKIISLEELQAKMQGKNLQKYTKTISDWRTALGREVAKMELDIEKAMKEADKSIADSFKKQVQDQELKFRNRINEAQIEGGDLGAAREMLEIYKEQIVQINKLEDAYRAAGYTDEEIQARRIAARKGVQQAEQNIADIQLKTTHQALGAAAQVAGGFSAMFDALGGEGERYAEFSKALAIFEVALQQAQAIAGAVANAAKYSIPWLLPVQIASSIAAVVAAIAQATQATDSAQTPKYASGGLVTGPGSGTSDSIPAMLSNGEAVMTAQAVNDWGAMLSAMNVASGGNAIQVSNLPQRNDGMKGMERMMERALMNMPAPIVSVVDINKGQKRVKVQNSLGKLGRKKYK
nr:MAG TPA: tail tape measure protein [Caudoviricetes sp.]